MATSRTNPIGEHYAELASESLGEFMGQTVTTEIVEHIAAVVSKHTLELVNQKEAAELIGLSLNGFLYATGLNSQSRTNPTPALENPPRWIKADLEAFAQDRAQRALSDRRIHSKS